VRAELLTVTAGAAPAPVEYAVAADRFLEQAWLSPASRRVYRISLASWLLTWLLAGRPCGPLFLTDRRAPASAAAGDVCPVTGRARMSYRRAAEIFTGCTRPLDPAGHGWTLHQLRRPAPAA
jgi:hypothetical protein